MRFLLAASVITLVLASTDCAQSEQTPAPGIRVALKRVIADETLLRPVHLAPLPGSAGELVIVEQDGVIRRLHPSAGKAAGVVLDLRAKVSRAGNEEGLLSVAFHPRFAENRFFYVYYSAAAPRRSIIARFTYDPASMRGKADSEAVLLEAGQPYSNHKGGQIAFGPDGYLYIALGDGGSGGDPHGNGQNRATLLGKLLRIDVDRRDPGLAYAIPPDNPFRGAGDGSRAEIWAYGLRNPWRFSFDRETGALYAGDVGQDAWEEIDRIVKGRNYGWNAMEGTHCFRAPECPRAGLESPVAEYGRGDGTSVTGGFVYRGRALAGLRGRYVFGDYGSGWLFTIPAGRAGLQRHERLLATRLAISSRGQDAAGELYVLDLNGALFQLVPAP
jgi:glucose/arabinose dehydrogenase